MQKSKPKNSGKYQWTMHAEGKMRFYGLSEQKVRSVIKSPERTEEGIVENTIAVMKPQSVKIRNGRKMWMQEIWVMYQMIDSSGKNGLKTGSPENLSHPGSMEGRKIRIISAWRYPGMSPKNDPIPEDIIREISSSLETSDLQL